MKTKLAILTVAAACVVALAIPSHAFTSKGKVVSTATVAVGGTPEVTFSIDLRDASDPTTDTDPPQITWTADAGNPWKIANQLLMMDHTITELTGGIQVYTDNDTSRKTGTVTYPAFQAPTAVSTAPSSNPAGLLLADGVNTETSFTLPVAWSIKSSTKVVDLADADRGIGATDPNTGSGSGYNNRYQWLYMLDHETPAIDRNGDGTADDAAFTDGMTFATMVKWPDGIHYGQDSDEFGGSPTGTSWVYLEADFSTALPSQTYNTNTITVEGFTD